MIRSFRQTIFRPLLLTAIVIAAMGVTAQGADNDIPNMGGDIFGLPGVTVIGSAGTIQSSLPFGGGSRRVKIAENNKALPVDRVYFVYNHFHDAFTATPPLQTAPVDQYTIGLEKTFADGLLSVELRLPFTSGHSASSNISAPPDSTSLAVNGGEVGNLSILLKALLIETESGPLVAGVGVNTPTGSDAHGRVRDEPNAGEGPSNNYFDFVANNQAVHILPFFGFLAAPDDRTFYHGFAQLDIDANGNRIDVTPFQPAPSPTVSRRLHEQTLLYLDVAAGYWLYRNPRSGGLTGLASLVELHYTTALQDADTATFIVPNVTTIFGNAVNRFDVLNFTVGIHAEIANNWTCRASGVFPLTTGDNRFFPAEVIISVNRRF